MHFTAAGQTHVGMKRSQNQDNLLMLPECGLFAVADGMGGHKGGETASYLAIETLQKDFQEKGRSAKEPGDFLRQVILAANANVQSRGQSEPQLMGMGTTMTALFFKKNHLYIGQVGDSRSYLLRPGKIWQLTRDHSLVQEKLRAGLISREQLKTDSMKNVITRSVGFEPEVEIDVYKFEIRPGDVFLACSDGLTGMLDDEEICPIVSEYAFDSGPNGVTRAVEALIERANHNGGEDNVTAILIRIEN